MVLPISEMRRRAEHFVEEFKEVSDERSFAQQYWRDFFNIFGIHWKDVAVFEQNVKKFDGNTGFIDCFWKGKLIIEHKSEGKNLNAAYDQAIGYLDTLSAIEKPRYIIVSDFKKIRLVDLFTGKKNSITLFDLPNNLQLFNFIYEKDLKHHEIQEDLNIEAAELMGKLYDSLLKTNYTGYDLELLLVRLLFCVYAEDTGIFEPFQFYDYIRDEENPSNVGTKIQKLFRILNQKPEDRQTNLDEILKKFPYVNGELFETSIVPPEFNYEMYRDLKNICHFDWSQISPAIFGSLFQLLMKPKERRNLGAHYTSETNIMKVINSLFMNDLWEEFYKSKKNYKDLELLREKIGNLKFLDPACGCGNFLIISFRELRLLEFAILKTEDELNKRNMGTTIQSRFDNFSKIKIENFYGIEIEEFPSMIAKVAMWFIEHQMDLKFEKLEIHKNNLPLKSLENIFNENSLKIDWKDILKPSDNVFILGNPPFVGKKDQTKTQKEEMKIIFKGFKKIGVLDYVTAWYKKALEYMDGTNIKTAFVSTSSIIQGEQVSALWKPLKKKYDVNINFAHRPFKWKNDAKNNAAVSVVIIGFSMQKNNKNLLFEYKNQDIPICHIVKNINCYLLDYKDIFIDVRNNPISNVPKIQLGNMANDSGNLIFTPEEKKLLLKSYPHISKYIKPFVGAKEFINGESRYCIWAVDDDAIFDLREIPEICDRFDKVREHRINSSRKQTQKLADFPSLFAEIRQPENDYLLIPLTTASSREYIPLGFVDKNIIVSNLASFINTDSLVIFGILNSKMHMTWLKHIAGRLGNEFRYSNTLVYNNFPFPKQISEKNKSIIISKSENILNIRKNFSNKTLFDLYTGIMPPILKKAHQELDNAVDKCYSSSKFKDDENRMKFLFNLYEEYTMK